MISIILLVLIYLAFISLGLPDGILGVSWPVIREEMNLPLDRAGPIVFLTTASTVLSSLLSASIIRYFGTGKVVFLSCLMTAITLISYSFIPSYFWLIVLAIPLGFGGGSVDTALNNYVALHFKAHHMNWLHSFWAVGTTLGPLIMSVHLTVETSWRSGYQTIGLMQSGLSIVLFLTLPFWKIHRNDFTSSKQKDDFINPTKFSEYKAHTIPGVKYSLLIFISYCTIEGAVGIWGSSYFIVIKNISVDTAATWIALYYGSIALGRFLSGFFAFKFAHTTMIRIGITTLSVGVVMMLFPLSGPLVLIPLVLIGLGLSPIFPAMIHIAPLRFGGFHSPTIIGFQTASANIGFALFVPLTGFILDNTAMEVFPFWLFFFTAVIYFCAVCLEKLYNYKLPQPLVAKRELK